MDYIFFLRQAQDKSRTRIGGGVLTAVLAAPSSKFFKKRSLYGVNKKSKLKNQNVK
jgi:hypothetical protein